MWNDHEQCLPGRSRCKRSFKALNFLKFMNTNSGWKINSVLKNKDIILI